MNVLIVGMPRSGTTLVQSLLCTDEKVASVPETHIFFQTRGIFKKTLLNKIKANLLWNKYKISQSQQLSFFFSLDPKIFLNHIFTSLRKFNGIGKDSIFVEKTPRHLEVIKPMLEILEDIKVVVVQRQFPETYLSLKKVSQQWNKKHSEADISTIYKRWEAYKHEAINVEEIFPDRVLIVNYENIINEKKRSEEINLINNFLKININYNHSNSHKILSSIISKKETWKENNFNKISDSSDTSYPKYLNDFLKSIYKKKKK